MQAVRRELSENKKYSGDPPLYLQYGYPNIDSFIAGWNCVCTMSEGKLNCSMSRHVYDIGVPILEPTTKKLIYNFHRQAGSGLDEWLEMPENDSRLFTKV